MYIVLLALAAVVLFPLGVKSIVDSRVYSVEGNSQESADTLALINTRVLLLLDNLPNTSYAGHLKRNYSSAALSEAPLLKGYTAYTVNKKDIYLCLKTRDTVQKVYPVNVLMYVTLHELAHMCNYDSQGNQILGHGKEFIDTFKCLVQDAINCGVYTKEDYSQKPIDYCGLVLNSQVLS